MIAETRYTMAATLEQIASTLRHGCSDHYCKLVPDKPKGMGTNGGCRCKEIPDTLLRLAEIFEMAKS